MVQNIENTTCVIQNMCREVHPVQKDMVFSVKQWLIAQTDTKADERMDSEQQARFHTFKFTFT